MAQKEKEIYKGSAVDVLTKNACKTSKIPIWTENNFKIMNL